MPIMLGLKFGNVALPSPFSNGFFLPLAALSRAARPENSRSKPVRQSSEICRFVTAKQCLLRVPLRRLQLPLNQSQHYDAQNTAGRFSYHRSVLESPLLRSRLAPPRVLRFPHLSASIQSPIRQYLQQNPHWRCHSTAIDPRAYLFQPLDPSSRSQSVRRGFAISLPILIIYLLLYLLNFFPQESKLSQQCRSTLARFWCYRRHEAFQNVASLGTYIMSQFTHNNLRSLAVDSLVLIGVASILGSIFSRGTFFVVYVLGGFLAVVADCAWTRVTNPCRSFTQAQFRQAQTWFHLVEEAIDKRTKLLLTMYTRKGFDEILTNTGDWANFKAKELKEQKRLFEKYYPLTKDYDKWARENCAARGSLVCLLSVATFLRPRTTMNFIGVRPTVLLYQLSAGIFFFNVYMQLATNSRLNHLDCLGGNLAAVLLWFLWLRRGRIGVLASGFRAFDQLTKPTSWLSVKWPLVLAFGVGTNTGIGIVQALEEKNARDAKTVSHVFRANTSIGMFQALMEKKARDAKTASESDPSQSADKTGNTLPEGRKDDSTDDKNTQEGTPAKQPAARNDDKSQKIAKD